METLDHADGAKVSGCLGEGVAPPCFVLRIHFVIPKDVCLIMDVLCYADHVGLNPRAFLSLAPR